jgi:uncharacterized RDD family membrane protein YckC
MSIAFEMLFRNRVLRAHWMKRAGAGILDIATVFVPVWAIALSFGLQKTYFDLFVGVASGVCWFIYSSLSEYFYGYTLGKKLASLRVSSERGDLSFLEASFRNIPKLFWFIMLPLDLLLGMFTYGDPRQRFIDRAFGTTVVSTLPASSLIHVKLKNINDY